MIDTIDTVTRAQVMAIANYCLDDDLEDDEIPGEVRSRVLEAAAKAPRIAGNAIWWDRRAECGCLAGWALGRAPTHTDPAAYDAIGVRYLDALVEIVGLGRNGAVSYANVLRVEDGESNAE